MKLTDFDKQPAQNAQQALREHYNVKLNVDKMSYPQVRTMLQKVRGLMSESRSDRNFHESQQSPAYLKLVFMEQALSRQFAAMSQARPRIVVENEEVEKSQVVLAAQDLVDSVQKMLEEVGQMQVKELPALVSSIESEIGVTESQTYDEQVSAALDSLSATLKETFTSMKAALGTVTGQETGIGALPGDEFGGDMGGEELDPEFAGDEFGGEVDASAELPDGEVEDFSADFEEPEEPMSSVGRNKR